MQSLIYLSLLRQKWAAPPPQGSSSSSATISVSSLPLSPLISTTALSFLHSLALLLLLLLSHLNSNSKPHNTTNNNNTFTPNLHNPPSLGPTIHGQSFPDFSHTSPPPATLPPPMVFLPPENCRRLKSVLACLSLEIDLTFSGCFR